MGLLSRLRSRNRPSSASSGAAPAPGAASQPQGDGPVTLEDRVEPGGQGSPDTNQAKAEPMSPSTEHPEPRGAPSLASMNVAAADPQAPSHPDVPRGVGQQGAAAASEPVPGSSGGAGGASRVPGQQGATPDGERITTDVAAGAAAMAPTADGPSGPHGQAPSGSGDTGPAPGIGEAPLAGSSEELPVVQGVRRPDVDEG